MPRKKKRRPVVYQYIEESEEEVIEIEESPPSTEVKFVPRTPTPFDTPPSATCYVADRSVQHSSHYRTLMPTSPVPASWPASSRSTSQTASSMNVAARASLPTPSFTVREVAQNGGITKYFSYPNTEENKKILLKRRSDANFKLLIEDVIEPWGAHYQVWLYPNDSAHKIEYVYPDDAMTSCQNQSISGSSTPTLFSQGLDSIRSTPWPSPVQSSISSATSDESLQRAKIMRISLG